MPDRKRQEWLARFKRFREQPNSVQAFCRSEGVSSASFYLWRRRLADEPREPPTTPAMFVPLTIASTPQPASVEVAFPNGIVFRLPADEHSLRALFALAREATC
jgi:transposase-like protein